MPIIRHVYISVFVALVLSVLGMNCSYAQERDSLRLYKKIKKAAYKYRLTRLAYDAVFVDPEPKEYPVQPAVPAQEKHVNPYLLYPGRIIRKINITVLDPFGNSVNDTVKHKVSLLQNAGNRMHLTTRRWIILNRLLFQESDTVNPLALSESERVLRQAVFVNDARIFITPTPSRDSVDVNVIVHDKWPVTVPLMITDVSANARLRNTNMIGLGQQFEQYIGWSRPDFYELNGSYNILNIDRTFISSRLSYQHTPDFTYVGHYFDRPFYSPLARWAGALGLNHNWKKHQYYDSVHHQDKHIPLNVFSYDAYLAKSFKLSNSLSLLNQSTNVILGLRHFNNIYLNRPGIQIDTGKSYRNWGAVIGNIGLAIQQYYKDKYIYRFGANEDVSEGLLIQLIYGGFRREFDKERFYSGMELARSKHFDFGYLSATVSYGVFYNTGVANDITTNLRLTYFSELLRKRNWYFRQFFYYTLVHGEHKLAGEKITLRSEEMYGMNNIGLTGTSKMILNSETVAYMPYNLIGFRFAPVVLMAFGMIGDQERPVIHSRIYQAYSLGVMFRNENLLSATFQVSFGFYPYLPDGNRNMLTYNPVGSFGIRVRGFAVTRPEFVSYY